MKAAYDDYYVGVIKRISNHEDTYFEFIRREGTLSVCECLKYIHPVIRIIPDSILCFILFKYSCSAIGWKIHSILKNKGN